DLDVYHESLKTYLDLNAVVSTSYGDGKREGFDEGISRGREVGRKEGRKEGLLEGKKQGQIESALNMLAKGFDLTDIADISGLSLKEIQAIANKL
ncbi:MAG: hypothetical protein JXR63_13585, partial [Spirochaetales bacterium]|nr:hypothetical protein [Spirochaetales bacterium]